MQSVPNIDFFWLNYDLFSPNWNYQVQNYQNVPVMYFNEKLGPYHLSFLSILFLYDPACKAWLFEKFISEVEDSYSFKITGILVRQVISLKKSGGVISKIYYLIPWPPICTPLILVSASMRMTSTSATLICNSMRVEKPSELLM